MPHTYNERELSYLAGIFDGEGWVSLCKNKAPRYTLYVGVANTYVPVLERLKKRFGGAIKSQGKKVNKQCYTWQVCANVAYEFLLVIRPFIFIKAQKADVAIAFFQQTKHDKSRVSSQELMLRESFRLQLRAAN